MTRPRPPYTPPPHTTPLRSPTSLASSSLMAPPHFLVSALLLLAAVDSAVAAPVQYQTLVVTPLSPHPSSAPAAVADDDVVQGNLAAAEDGATAASTVHFRVVHRDAFAVNATAAELFAHRLERDGKRAARISAAGGTANGTRGGGRFVAPVVSGLAQGSGEYFTKIGVGTPATPVLMVLDTGSDVVWLQCAPCRRCYEQSGKVFDPRGSRSYGAVDCAAPLCRRLDSGGCDLRRRACLYQVAYGDGSITAGNFATETLTFAGGARVARVALGCGHDNEGLFVAAAGLLGLGRGTLSFPTQISRRFGRSFSYCLVDRTSSSCASSRLSRREIIAFAGQQSWDIGRFVRTLYFFNGPPNPLKIVESIISSITGSAPGEAPKKMETSDVVLVTGATGGVGRRVVDILQKKGLPVRVLVRNEEKARSMLGPDVDLIIGDVTTENTLDPSYFKGIKKVVSAVSVIVGPKEGDTPDRQKYKQGIKFFEPEIKGPSPEMVEYIGMQNLINAVKNSVGLSEGKLLFGFKGNLSGKLVWGALDDVVMGGVSESAFQIQPTGSETGGPTGLFKGTVSTSNNGGFTSIRTKNFTVPEDLSSYDGIELQVKGDGRRYKLIVRTSFEWDTVGYIASFDTTKGEWQSVRIPFSSLKPVFRARTMADAPPFDASNITSLQLMFSKFEYDGKLNPTFTEGPFELPFSSIRAYINEPITPRFVHVSSAGVTRPERPGLDLSKQPPAVRLNKELGSILTYKLKGEDLIRESGIPYTIVRPCALTEEPAGADLIFDQGDNITGKIAREEVAHICVAALSSPNAVGKTFEVKSTVPFSEPYVIDPSNPPPEKDYEVYFKELKGGVTGKEALEGTPAQV